MKLSKKTWIIIGVVALLAGAAFLFLRSRSGQTTDDEGNEVAPGGSADLNSVAPELVGGSSGPVVGPAVSLPVNITLTEQASQAPKPQVLGPDMDSGPRPDMNMNPVHRQRGGMPPARNAGVTYPDRNGRPNSDDDEDDSG